MIKLAYLVQSSKFVVLGCLNWDLALDIDLVKAGS